jgi:phosphoenolpyruvate carboxylase
MKRAADELGFTSREQMLSLRALKPGEFYAFGPAISDEVQKVVVGDVQTTHPKAGSRSLTKVVPPTTGIKKILGKLADLPQEAEKEAKTADELRQRILTLQREKSILEKAPGSNPAAVEAAVANQVETVRREIERNANQEIQKERDEQTKTNREWQVLLNAWIKYAEDLKKIITALGPIITRVEAISLTQNPKTKPAGS